MSRLRGFQRDLKNGVYQAWQNGAKVVMPVLPTGGGKTVVVADIAKEFKGHGCIMAHRKELVTQLSVAMAREELSHGIIAPAATIKSIVKAQIRACGRTWYDPRSNWKVASVDTIIRRDLPAGWLETVGLVVQDEGHHTLRKNKWGKAFDMFPNALGLLPTATPCRADGHGLGRHAEGLVDSMVVGPNMRWMIENAFLTDYIIRAPQASDFDRSGIEVSSSTGDLNEAQMRTTVKRSNKIVGDVVETYLKYANGLLGITFAVDVEHATTIAAAFNAKGVPAAVVSADTPGEEREEILAKFERRELLQLVNVDLFGEGFDLPAIQCVSMARPTASYSLYAQQFGRALRLMISSILAANWDVYSVEQRKQFLAESEKPVAFIFDHVGNIIAHNGPPDRPRNWSLDSVEKRAKSAPSLLRVCLNPICEQPYERYMTECPYCGWEVPPPLDRSKPSQVDGDLTLYTQELIDQLWGESERIMDEPVVPYSAPANVQFSVRANHQKRIAAQYMLRDTIAQWAGHNAKYSDRENYRRFFIEFGVDVMTAKTLNEKDAMELHQRVRETLQ